MATVNSVKIYLIQISVIFLVQGLNPMVSFSQNSGNAHENIHKITADSVIQTTSYTYVLGNENNNRKWLAFPKKDIKQNNTYYYSGGVEMKDFKSKELNRIFKSVLFLNGIVSPDEILEKKDEKEKDIKIVPPEDGLSIGELFENKNKYAGQLVRIKGKVSKYNSNIMNRNWIHLIDGSKNSEDVDFTATSTMETEVGKIITIEGTIVLNKDFGAGYKYELIMENGKIIN